MNKLTQLALILFVAIGLALGGCGGEDAATKDPTADGEDENSTETENSTDGENTENGENTNTGGDIDAACTQVCDYLITCLGQLTCDPALGEFDAAACVADCVTRGEMNQASAANYVNQSCDDVNRSQCNASPDQFANCDCPDAPQGNCAEGLFCTIPLTDSTGNTLYACGDETGSAPTDAPACSQTEPACTDTTQQCILFSADGTEGYCLGMCEQ